MTSLALFVPSEELTTQRAVFQVYLEDNPLDVRPLADKLKECFDKETADRLIKLSDINPEAKKWLLTGNIEFRVRLKLLEQRSMQALEDVLANDDPKASNARVNAAKYLLELAGKSVKTLPQQSQKLEDAIARMSEIELKALMESADGTETTVEVKRKKPKIVDAN